MRVLHVNMTLDPSVGAGTAERTFRLARAMGRAGAASSVLTLDLGLTPERVAAAAPAEVIALPCLSQRFYLPACLPRRVFQAVREADVVHLMNHWTLLNALAYWAARRSGTPYVVCPAGGLRLFGRSRGIKRLYNRVIGRRIIADAQGHFAITDAERSDFAAYGVDPAAVRIMPNGVDPEDLDAGVDVDVPALRARLGVGAAPFVLFVGRLHRIKGPDLLVEAFAGLGASAREHHLVLAGPDEGLGPQLRARAERLGVADRIHLVGPLHGAAKTAAYAQAALLAVPSRLEAMSLVALEAGVTGTPVLLTRECGFDEVETFGGGLAVPASAAGLRDGLRQLLADPDRLPAMGQRLRELVLTRFTWQQVAAGYIRGYTALVGLDAVDATPGLDRPASTTRQPVA